MHGIHLHLLGSMTTKTKKAVCLINWVCVAMAVEVYGDQGSTYLCMFGHVACCEIFSAKVTSTVQHIYKNELDTGQTLCEGLTKQG